jgi:hypothetical protein
MSGAIAQTMMMGENEKMPEAGGCGADDVAFLLMGSLTDPGRS